MDLLSEVRIYNEAMGAKGAKGRLMGINSAGYYQVTLEVQGRQFETYFPIASTVVMSGAPTVESERIEVER